MRPLYYNIKNYVRFLQCKPRALGFIFMLHRVAEWDDGKIRWNEYLKISPNKLDSILTSLKKKYEIISLNDVTTYLSEKHKKKFVVFTFDDGYKDNLTNALPIFKKHNVPFTIFLTSDFMDRKAILWWYLLEDLLLSHNEVILSNGKKFACSTMDEKSHAFLTIRDEILKINQNSLFEGLTKLFDGYKIDWFSKCEELCLSWDDVQRLTKEPLVTLGAHTQHHYNLTLLSTEDDVYEEIMAGIKTVEKHINTTLSTFAYPYGLANQREISVVSSMNDYFNVAVMAGGGAVTNECKNAYALPRFFIEESFDRFTLIRETDCCIL